MTLIRSRLGALLVEHGWGDGCEHSQRELARRSGLWQDKVRRLYLPIHPGIERRMPKAATIRLLAQATSIPFAELAAAADDDMRVASGSDTAPRLGEPGRDLLERSAAILRDWRPDETGPEDLAEAIHAIYAPRLVTS